MTFLFLLVICTGVRAWTDSHTDRIQKELYNQLVLPNSATPGAFLITKGFIPNSRWNESICIQEGTQEKVHTCSSWEKAGKSSFRDPSLPKYDFIRGHSQLNGTSSCIEVNDITSLNSSAENKFKNLQAIDLIMNGMEQRWTTKVNDRILTHLQ